MSELKAFRIIQGDTGGYGAPSYKCDPDGNRLEEWGDICEVYDRGEVDAYLYEKDKELAFLRKHLESIDNLVKEHKDLLLESQKMHLKCANNASTQILRLTRYLYLILADLHASKAQEYARASLVGGKWLDDNDEKQCYRKEKCAARCRERADRLGG